ncbi:MAG: 30S ribosomal protein S7 [Chloroflexi bacterium]|jgi:small subunit ribosomal protein S7|nr:30S ribosomal protein S7 [Chloroflexota bacterium]
MPRRNRPERRHTPADPKFNSLPVQQAINKIMLNGKKGTAERIMYDALARVEERLRQDPLEAFNQALRNVTPQMEVKPRRVGGATYQVPIEIRAERRNSLAIRWLVGSARSRRGKAMSDRLAEEILDAFNNTGTAVKRREDTHRMAEANRAFAHYRW